MLISSHFPINCMKRGISKLDFPFVLTHLWSQGKYRRNLEPYGNTFGIVDNGMHENGQPLPIHRIADVLDQNPGWIGILPDRLHKPIWTWGRTIRAIARTGISLQHWGMVLHGASAPQIHFQHDLAVELGVGLICFPFRAPRWNYLTETKIDFRYEQRYHLMGLNEQDRLEEYAKLPGKWSIDSMKIWKVDLTQPNWHGHKVDHEYYNVDWGLVNNNMSYLKERTYGRAASRVPDLS